MYSGLSYQRYGRSENVTRERERTMTDLFESTIDLFGEGDNDLFPTFNPPTQEKEKTNEYKEEERREE